MGSPLYRRRYARRVIGLVSMAVLLLVAACSSGGGGNGKVTLVYAGFGGDFGKAEESAYIQPYMKLHPNVKIVYDDTVDFAKMKAMVQSHNVTWDIFTGDLIVRDAQDYMEKLDCKIVPCSQIVKANNVNPYVSVYYSYAEVLTYNKQAFGSNPPKTWQDFFNTKKYPGKRALNNQAPYIDDLIAALMGDGVAPNKIWPNLDVKRALAELSTIKNDTVWYTSNQQCAQMVQDGEASMGLCLNGRVYDAEQSGANKLAVSWDKPIVGYGAISIPKGSAHVDEAMKFIAYVLNKNVNARLSKYIPYGPTNKEAFNKADPKTASWLPSAHLSGPYAQYDWNDFAQYGTAAVNQFQAWLQG